MLEKIGNFFALSIKKVLPDSFVFAIALTFITILLAIGTGGLSTKAILGAWVSGVFNTQIIMFAFSMIMVISFGYCIGVSPPFRIFFNWLVKFINKPWQVYVSIVLISVALMLLNWGLGPVCAIFTVEVCKRVKGVDFRLACASLYSGILVWHGGLSSSAALMMATEQTAKAFIDKGIISGVIPVSETLLLPMNLCMIMMIVIGLPILFLLMRPKTVDPKYDAALRFEKEQTDGVAVQKTEVKASTDKMTLADRMNNSLILTIFISFLCLIGCYIIITSKGFNLASLSLLMLGFGLLMHGRPIRYVDTMKDAIKGTSDIPLLFPLFGGIMSIFVVSGLAVKLATGLTSIATAETVPFFSFLTSAVVNLFIPSGGGEWLVLGAPLLQAVKLTGASVGKTIVAFSYGDALTNLINPFWTLTFLPIMGHLINLRPKDFMGYTVLVCLIFFVLESLIILFM